MDGYNESNVICSHHNIEIIVLFHYVKGDLKTIKEICFENRVSNNDIESYDVDLSKLIDLPKFQSVFKTNIKTTKIWDRILEETHSFIASIKEYYNIDLRELNEYQLLDFLIEHCKNFNSPKDLIKLNCFGLGARGFDINFLSVKKMIKQLNHIKKQLVLEKQ